MKKHLIAFILLCCLCLAACTHTQPDPTVPPATPAVVTPSPVPETPAPSYCSGTARVGDIGVLFRTLDRGEALTVVGLSGGNYIVSLSDCERVYVDRRFIRTEFEPAPEAEREVYASWGAKLYIDVYLKGDYITPDLNTPLTLLDSLSGVAMLSYEGRIFYARLEELSAEYIYIPSGSGEAAPAAPDGGDSSWVAPPSGGADGGDISLASAIGRREGAYISALSMPDSGSADIIFPCSGVAFCDGVNAYLMYTRIGQELTVTDFDDARCTLNVDGLTAYLPRWAVIIEPSDEYTPWRGYLSYHARVYSSPALSGDGSSLPLNTEVEVIFAQDDVLVAVHEREIVFIPASLVSPEPVYVDYGSSAAVDAGAAPASDAAEWTAPAL